MQKIFIFFIVIYLILLNGFFNSFYDEANWIQAGQSFKNALISLNPKDTYVGFMSLHPGVTVLWISALIQLIFPNLPLNYLLIIHRLIFLSITFILLITSGKFLLRYFKKITLVVVFFYLLMEPHFIVNGILTWLDLLLTTFVVVCILAWISVIHHQNKSALLISGISLGLALLTKYMGLYLLPMIVISTLFYAKTTHSPFTNFIKPICYTFLIGFITFFILYPAMWVNPYQTLFSRFDTQVTTQTITTSESVNILLNLYRKLTQINPVILFSIALLAIDLFKKKKISTVTMLLGINGLIYLFSLTGTILIVYDQGRGYFAFLQSIDRYLLPAVPFFSLYFFDKFLTDKSSNKIFSIGVMVVLFSWELYWMFIAG